MPSKRNRAGAASSLALESRSLAHLLRARAEASPDRELLRFEGRSATCAEVQDLTNRLAAVLTSSGVRPGDRVAIMLPNGIEFPIAWLGVAKARSVVVPVNVQYREADLVHLLRDSGASTVIAAPELVDLVRAVRGSCPALRDVRALGGPSHREDTADLRPAMTQIDASCDIGAIAPADLVTIQYTSGTTGFPKGCMLTHAYWLTVASTARRFAAIDANDVLLTAQPFSYMDPMWNLVLAMLTGAPLVVLPRFSASTFWHRVRANAVTFFYCLGTMPLYLLKQPVVPEVERDHRVRLVMCSGIPPQLHAAFEDRWGCLWREAYGTTELGCVLVVPPDDTTCVGTGAMGKPVRGREVRVVDERGREVRNGEVGELLVRGQAVMLGYYNDAAATAGWMVDGWAHTGDLARRDSRGYYHFVGRIKDMIRRAGENISAAEVEAVLSEHPGVRAAACIPVPDELRGEEVKAYVQLQPRQTPQSVSPRDLIAFVQHRLAAFKIPRYYEYIDVFPLTPSERIAKSTLRAAKPDHRCGAYDASSDTWG